LSRKIVLLIGFLACLGAALISLAQWPQNSAKQTLAVGILHPTKNDIETFEGFRTKLAALGYDEGTDVDFYYDGPTGPGDKLTATAEEMVRKGVDLIFASGTPAAIAATKAADGSNTTVVFGPVSNPVGVGIVETLRRPGGHVTGVTLPKSASKRMKWLIDIAPNSRTVLIPFNPNDKSSVTSMELAKTAAETLSVEVLALQVQSIDAVEKLIKELPERADSIFLPRDSMISGRVVEIAAAAVARGLPLSAPGLKHVGKGGLVSYGFAHFEVGERAAELADKIFRGASPADLPVETASSFLAINLKTAEALGLPIQRDHLKQARDIIR
jgi:putative ABC transport system substrate-binding protein